MAEALRSKIKETRIRTASGGGGGAAKAPVRVANNGGAPAMKLTKEQMLAAQAAAQEALARKLGSVGGRTEKVIGGAVTSQVTSSQLSGMCRSAAPDLRACSRAHAGESPFTAMVHINTAGGVDKVDALVGGSRNAALSACALGKLGRKKFGLQERETNYKCEVN